MSNPSGERPDLSLRLDEDSFVLAVLDREFALELARDPCLELGLRVPDLDLERLPRDRVELALPALLGGREVLCLLDVLLPCLELLEERSADLKVR